MLTTTLIAAAISGCSVYQKPQRAAWRAQAENACFAEKRVQASQYIQPVNALEGAGVCGMTRPLKVSALQNGAVAFNSTATLDCSMTAALDTWLTEVIQPAAQARFGMPVAQINSMGSYACRGMNNQAGAALSEHSFGNALDIGGFVLADGRVVSIVRDWTRGDEQTRAFLRDVQAGACDRFTTVLAPGSNVYHYNHIHVDLAMHGNSSRGPRRVCKPAPQNTAPLPRLDTLPDAPDIDDEIDMALNDLKADPRGPTTRGEAQTNDPRSYSARSAYNAGGGIPAGLPPAPFSQVPVSRLPAMQPLPPPRALSSAPLSLDRSAAIRSDGAFVPAEDDNDVTSSVKKR